MAQTANEALFDAGIRHQIHLERVKTSIVKEINDLLSRADRDLVGIIDKNKDSLAVWSQQRRKAVLTAIRKANKAAFLRLGEELPRHLLELADTEVKFNAALLRRYVPIQLDMTMPTRELLEAAVTSRPFKGRILGDWVKEIGEAKYRRIRDAINIGLVEGETIDQISRRVRGTRSLNFRDGVIELSRRDAHAIVRTAATHTTAKARDLLYETNDDLIKGVEWVSTLDSRTTPICRSRDGEVYPVGEGPRPPAHVGCRSTTVPVTKSWRELGIDLDEAPESTRASMDGQVAESTRYEDWLRRQPKPFVADVLGKAKSKLFLDGNLKLEKFVDFQGDELTLKELANKQSKAWTLVFGD